MKILIFELSSNHFVDQVLPVLTNE